MALPTAVVGATRPSYIITWSRETDATPEVLTGATITGKLRHLATKVTRDITGTLTVTDGPNAIFTWQRSTADVAQSGAFVVEFTATFASAPTIARTMQAAWTVLGALG